MLDGKVVFITGSSRGIGAATARLLAEHGAAVAVNFRSNRDAGEEVARAIREAGGRAILVQADVTEPAQVEAAVATATKELGPIDVLVNNANIDFPIVPFLDYAWEDFERKLLHEMKASFHTCRAVAPAMAAAGGGSIVNVSSGLSRVPGPGFVAHSSAKSALDAFSRALAMELGPKGIRVNVVAPGLTLTDATEHLPDEAKEGTRLHTPLGRLGLPEDVAGAVLFFASDASRFVTGTYLPVCGGSQMS
jgi:3-oxoacyl-[acyl-carrier protein] reductase